MADVVRNEVEAPQDVAGKYLQRRWREVRAGEYAPEISILGVAGGIAVTTSPKAGTITDRSGTTSATINTGTRLMNETPGRSYLFIQNVGGADIWVNIGGPANGGQPSIKITPNGTLVFESGFIPDTFVNVISATASVPYTAKEAS